MCWLVDKVVVYCVCELATMGGAPSHVTMRASRDHAQKRREKCEMITKYDTSPATSGMGPKANVTVSQTFKYDHLNVITYVTKMHGSQNGSP